MVERLERLEAQDPVQVEVQEDLLTQLERLESSLRITTRTNKPTIDALNTLRVDINKIIEHRSSLPNRRTKTLDITAYI